MPSTTRRWLSWSVAAAFYLFDVFLRLSTDVVTQDLQRDFSVGADTVASAFGASFFYAYASVQLLVGIFLDRAGPKLTISACALLAGSGAVIFGCAPSVAIGTLGRVMSGVGCGAGWLGAVKVVRNSYGTNSRTADIMLGVTCMLGGVGGLASQAPLRLLTEAVGWRTAFKIVGAGVGGVICIASLVLITDVPLTTQPTIAPEMISTTMDVDCGDAEEEAEMGEVAAAQEELVSSSSSSSDGDGSGDGSEGGGIVEQLCTTLRVLKSVVLSPRIWLYAIYLGCTDAPFEAFAGLTGVSFFEQAVGGSVGAIAATFTMICVIVATVAQLLGGPLIATVGRTYSRQMLFLIAFALIGALGYLPALLPLADGASPPDSVALWAAAVSAVGLSVGSCTVIWHVISTDPLCGGSAATGVVAGAVNTFVIATDAVTQSVFGIILGGGTIAGGSNGTLTRGVATAVAAKAKERVYSARTYSTGFLLLVVEFIVAAVAAALALGLRKYRDASASAQAKERRLLSSAKEGAATKYATIH